MCKRFGLGKDGQVWVSLTINLTTELIDQLVDGQYFDSIDFGSNPASYLLSKFVIFYHLSPTVPSANKKFTERSVTFIAIRSKKLKSWKLTFYFVI